jgi:hypothetical protein
MFLDVAGAGLQQSTTVTRGRPGTMPGGAVAGFVRAAGGEVGGGFDAARLRRLISGG